MLSLDGQEILEHVARCLRDAEHIHQAIGLVRGVVAFLEEAYGWEGFWEDFQFGNANMHQHNGKQLREFLRQFEEVFPELKEKKSC